MKSTLTLWTVLVVVTGLLMTGCTQSPQVEPVQADMPTTLTIKADCIAHYYRSDSSAYITQQQHVFIPSNGAFSSVSQEPMGTVTCSLSKELFQSSNKTPESLSDLPQEFWDQYLATSVFYGFCAGGDLLDISSMKIGEKVKIEGQWYQSYKPDWPSQFNITLLQSLDTDRFELVKMEDTIEALSWLLRFYNHRYSNKLERTVPRTIDVFDIHSGIASKVLMIRFDYKDIK
jgi:hypothetical protein